MAEALIRAAGPFRRLLADKGYDADHFRQLLRERGAEVVIPSTASRRASIPYDTVAYRDRNKVEGMWCRLKDFRLVATRYDKLARNYLAFLHRCNLRLLAQLSLEPRLRRSSPSPLWTGALWQTLDRQT